MELEKYIKVVREAINTGYYDVQDALMNRDESLKGAVNSLYSELNAKKLKDSGVDLTDECEFYKYQQVLNRQLSYGRK